MVNLVRYAPSGKFFARFKVLDIGLDGPPMPSFAGSTSEEQRGEMVSFIAELQRDLGKRDSAHPSLWRCIPQSFDLPAPSAKSGMFFAIPGKRVPPYGSIVLVNGTAGDVRPA